MLYLLYWAIKYKNLKCHSFKNRQRTLLNYFKLKTKKNMVCSLFLDFQGDENDSYTEKLYPFNTVQSSKRGMNCYVNEWTKFLIKHIQTLSLYPLIVNHLMKEILMKIATKYCTLNYLSALLLLLFTSITISCCFFL